MPARDLNAFLANANTAGIIASAEPIGVFAATASQPSTPYEFTCWLSYKEELHGELELGNIVVVVTEDPPGQVQDLVFGIVQNLSAVSDVTDIISAYKLSDFGNPSAAGIHDPAVVLSATVGVLRSDRELARPITRGKVYLAGKRGIAFALNITDDLDNPEELNRPGWIPIGLLRNTKGIESPLLIDERRVIGPLGAHINITGMSGEAAKTSYILYFLKALFTHATTPVAAVVINDKHADLLALEERNPELGEEDHHFYEVMGVPPAPFERVRYFGPRNGFREAALSRRPDASYFCWELDKILNFENPSHSPLLELLDESCREEKALGVILDLIEDLSPDNPNAAFRGIRTFEQLKNAFVDQRENQHYRGHAQQTVDKVRRRLLGLPKLYQGVVGTGITRDIPFAELRKNEIFAIDIASLTGADDRAKRFILTYTLQSLTKVIAANRRSGAPDRPQAVVVFIDELNKHCPASGEGGPLKDAIIEVHARGRSAGVVAAGAEQLLSKIDPQVLANTSTQVYGRTDMAELRDSLYSEFSDSYRQRLKGLRQGHRLVKHTRMQMPTFVFTGRPPCKSGDSMNERPPVVEEEPRAVLTEAEPPPRDKSNGDILAGLF